MMEAWSLIPGYRGDYEASSLGRIRSLRCRPWGKAISRREPKILKSKANPSNGYFYYQLYDDDGGHFIKGGKLVLLAFRGPPPSNQHTVAHGDGVRTNDRLDNLRWATRSENEKDKIAHGTYQYGEQNPSAILTRTEVDEIKQSSLTQRKLAAIYGVSQTTISNIKNEKSWRN